MNDPQTRAKAAFEQRFGQPAERTFYAPGRVNLIGEHTDYNNGFVLPAAIDRGTAMAIRLRDDNRIAVTALDISGETSEWSVAGEIEKDAAMPWSNYLRGVVRELMLAGHTQIRGMDVVVAGNIPQGAGLSSSASFSVAFAAALSHLNDLNLSPTQWALFAQAAENNFAGCNCGIMDQLISAAGEEGHALLIDCQSLDYTPVAMPDELRILIIDSKVKRGLVDSEYNDRRQQCERAAKGLGVSSLREATLTQLNNASLDDIAFRRARHIITENQRTLEACDALRTGNAAVLGRLMRESHQSMRDDFEITVPPVDFLAQLVGDIVGEHGGARMTGGGFGGCVVSLLPEALIEEVGAAVATAYPKETGLEAELHLCIPSRGARELL